MLVRNLSSVVGLEYETPSGVKYITTNLLAVIIDYGLSHAMIRSQAISPINQQAEATKQGTHVGAFGYEKYGVYHDRSEPLHDIFKLLLMSMRSMRNAGNTACLQGAARLLRYFDTRDTLLVLKELEDNYFSYPTGVSAVLNAEVHSFETRSLDDFLLYAGKAIGPTLLLIEKSNIGNIPVLTCDKSLENTPNAPKIRYSAKQDIQKASSVSKGPGLVNYIPGKTCTTNVQAFAELGMVTSPLKIELLSLYDLYRSYTNSLPRERVPLLQRNQALYTQGALQVKAYLERQIADLRRRCAFPLVGTPSLKQVDDLAYCFTIAAEIKVSIDILSFLASLYKDQRSVDVAQLMGNDMEKIRNTSLIPSLIVLQNARDTTSDEKAKEVYTSALKTLS